jgi:hypothetical protein
MELVNISLRHANKRQVFLIDYLFRLCAALCVLRALCVHSNAFETSRKIFSVVCLFSSREFRFSSQQQMIKKLTLDDGGLCVVKTRITSIYLSLAVSAFVKQPKSFKIFLYSNWVVIAKEKKRAFEVQTPFEKTGPSSRQLIFQFSLGIQKTEPPNKSLNFSMSPQSDL